MSRTAASVVLFDLDGTVSDSAPGIVGSLRAAFSELGLPPLTADQERSLLGPPFYLGLPPIVGAPITPLVIATYRRYYTGGGMFETTAYDGMPELIAELAGRGTRLAVATSKAEEYAVPVVAHLGLADYFVTVGGDTLAGGRPSKALVIAEVLRRLGAAGSPEVVMVGDRYHDVDGARVHGIDTLGAGWGYAAPGELVEAGARAVFDTPAGLAAELLGGSR